MKYRIDAVAGVVYGRSGRAIGRVDGRGYLASSRAGRIHRLIWMSVYGPIPDGLQINHINGVKTDNRIANLELVTPSENCLHAYRLGLSSAKGEKNGRAKLTAVQARDIRARVASGESRRAIAREVGVDPRTVRDIIAGRLWSPA